MTKVAEKKQIKVKLPRTWEATKEGCCVTIPYKQTYGNVVCDTIPTCVVRISCNKDNIVLHADKQPHLPAGSCLIFTGK